MPKFLFEIGLEEVPARMLAAAQAELLKRTLALFTREQLIGADAMAKSYSTPRRLAVLIEDVREQQDDITEETTGPAVKIAFKDGVATPAAEAFARKAGVAVSELRTISTPKGEYLAATTVKKGRSAAVVIAEELHKEIAAIYWAKNMYWRAGKPERFVRPVVWMVCLLGDAVVPVEFGGKVAGRASYGHRVLSSGEAFEIVAPESYLAQLEGEYVIADVEARRHKIRKALDHVTRTVAGLRWREDEALVDAVTHLTEWPDVLLGNFESAYLELPEEVLVTVMRDHQKYFAVEDADGKLAPHFLTVTNIALDETNAAIIRQGNERVLRARFNDARFFWEFDQRTPLVDRVKLLENVTFQKELGSYAEKTERVRALSAGLANTVNIRGQQVDFGALEIAAHLAKTDLTTELVKEFTELQGVIGGLYARKQGHDEKVWSAIYDQYKPSSMDDECPRSMEGVILAIADKTDLIAGMFGLGLEPTGSKDPFALRRAGNGIIKILGETDLKLTLQEITASLHLNDFSVSGKINKFLKERLTFFLRETCGYPYDVVNAVAAADGREIEDVRDAMARAQAISALRDSEEFVEVCNAFRRVRNILSQTKGKNFRSSDTLNALVEPSELALRAELDLRMREIKSLRDARDYVAALAQIAAFGPLLTVFFEEVMVLTEEEEVRAARLRLLSLVFGEFARIADFSEIVVAG